MADVAKTAAVKTVAPAPGTKIPVIDKKTGKQKLDKDGNPKFKVVKEKVAKPKHPAVGSADKNVYPFKSVPADYQFGKMEQLDKTDFVDHGVFLNYHVARAKWQLAKLVEKAEDWRKTGGTAGKALRRFNQMQKKLAEMREQLKAAGIDPDAVLSAAAPPTK